MEFGETCGRGVWLGQETGHNALSIRYGWGATPSTPPPLAHWPWWVRSGLVAAIFGIGVYLYFWPRVA